MKLTIHLPKDLIEDIKVEAKYEGIPVDEWLTKIVRRNVWRREAQNRDRESRPHISKLIVENMKDVPLEDLAKHPRDGASEHDHYIYGTPKRIGD